MTPPSIHELAGWLTDPRGRAEAAARISSMLGVAAFVILLRDPEIGAPRPAPGFPQTLPGGPTWTRLLARAAAGGEFTAEIAFPDRQTLTTARVFAADNGAVFLLIGGEPTLSPTEFGRVPLLSALLYAELAQSSAKGVAKAAQDATQRATMLASALDSARNEIERKAAELSVALIEADRLNAELRELNETLEQRVAAEIEERMRAEEGLRHAQRLEALGQLTGGVAHDINNLLTPIIGSLDLLRMRHNDERSQRQIGAALASADRAKSLVSRLLAFARRQVLQPKPVDVGQAVEGLRDFMASSLGPSIQLTLDVAEGLPPAQVDPVQLELAIINLAINSRDAMPTGGTLTITTSAHDVGAAQSPDLRPGRYVCITIADTGEGMDEATLRKAVEPFFTTKGLGKGTGLGLSMVHGLAAQSGGRLELTSRPAVGTTATLWLPVSDGPVEGLIVDEAVPPEATDRRIILVVDDEDLVRATTADLLSELGYEVVEASSASDALIRLRKGLHPDLIVTDQKMPGMTGRELAREVMAAHAELPVLLITGYDELSGDETQGLEILSKPFRYSDLANKVAALLERK